MGAALWLVVAGTAALLAIIPSASAQPFYDNQPWNCPRGLGWGETDGDQHASILAGASNFQVWYAGLHPDDPAWATSNAIQQLWPGSASQGIAGLVGQGISIGGAYQDSQPFRVQYSPPVFQPWGSVSY